MDFGTLHLVYLPFLELNLTLQMDVPDKEEVLIDVVIEGTSKNLHINVANMIYCIYENTPKKPL